MKRAFIETRTRTLQLNEWRVKADGVFEKLIISESTRVEETEGVTSLPSEEL